MVVMSPSGRTRQTQYIENPDLKGFAAANRQSKGASALSLPRSINPAFRPS
jgi:hypothetical protein